MSTLRFLVLPNATVNYFDGTNNQTIVLNATGNATIPATLGASDLTYSLVDVSINGLCTQALFNNATVSVTPPPNASISVAPVSACEGDDVVFIFSGTPNASVTYNDGFGVQNINLDGTGNANINISAGTSNIIFTLINVSFNSCTQTLSDGATLTVSPLPIAATAIASNCDEGSGQAIFDLTSLNNTVNGGSGEPVNWYLDDMAQSLISTPSNYLSGNGTVYATFTEGACTSDPVAITLELNDLPTFNMITDDCTSSNLRICSYLRYKWRGSTIYDKWRSWINNWK